ncbi:MAG: dual specificity protein phosphatase family protein [bacterium]
MELIEKIFKWLFHNQDSGIFRQILLNAPGKLYTSPMPFGAYDYGNRLLNIYKKNKIQHVFLLVTDTELKKKARRDLLKLYAKNDISYSRYVIHDLQAPSIEVINDLVQEAVERLKTQRVIIHCHAGVGRTSVAVCCIVIAVEGFTVDKAIEYVCKNMSVNITSEQKYLIQQFEASFQFS